MRQADYKYMNNRASSLGDEIFRYTGITTPKKCQLKVKHIFHDLKDDKIGSDFVAYFGYHTNIFFVLSIHGDFIYSRSIKPIHEDIIKAEEGKKIIDDNDDDLLMAYSYAFDFMLPAEEYIVI